MTVQTGEEVPVKVKRKASTKPKLSTKTTAVATQATVMPLSGALTNLPILTNEYVSSDLASMPEEMRQRAEEVSKGVSLADSTSIASFASDPQRQMSGHLDTMLENIRANQLGDAGELIAELATGLKGLDFSVMQGEAEGTLMGKVRGRLGKLPMLGKAVSHMERLHARNENIQEHLSSIEARAQLYMGQLRKGNNSMDELLNHTEANLYDLAVWLHGGELALVRIRQEFEAEKVNVIDSRDPVRLVRLKDMGEQIAAFETRLVRLQIAFTQGMQSIPQVRMAQQAARIEFQNTMDTILTDIPSIKSAILRILMLKQISTASDASAARRRLSRDLGRIGQDMLESAYTKAKNVRGDFTKDIEFLAEIARKQSDLGRLSSRMDIDARKNREQAIKQIIGIRAQFIDDQREQALVAIGSNEARPVPPVTRTLKG